MRPNQKPDSAAMLKFIRGFIQVNGESPTLQMLARRYGTSVNFMHGEIKRMEDAGEITRTKEHRSIRVERKVA